jgi:fibronectin type 3 domain-containing protein
VGSPTSASFASTGLASATTYFYVVKAVDPSGSSASSAAVSATTSLGVPTGVVASAVSPTEIDLAWTPVSGATGYVVQRGTTSGGPYTSIGSPTSTSFADTGLSPATTYYYVVKATTSSVTSAPSSEVSAKSLLGVPTGVVATAGSPSEIDLAWSQVTGATGYVVERGTTSGGPYTVVGSPTAAGFADTGLSPATTYYYVVKATTSSVSSALSVEFSATTLLGTPTGVLATPISTSEIDLTWSSVTGATGYTVLRGTTSGGPYTAVGSPTSTSFANTGLSPATTYYYVIRATVGSVTSTLSTEVSAQTLPAAPTGLVATAVSPSEIDLTWNPVSGATGYVVLRANASAGPYTAIGSPTSTSFANTGLSSNTTYYYVVQATDRSGNSANSATVSATTQLAAPTGLVATGKEESEIDLTWNPVTGATSYVVQRALVSGGPYTTVGTTTTASFADTGRPEEIYFYYVVEAVNAGGAGPASAEAAGRIP